MPPCVEMLLHAAGRERISLFFLGHIFDKLLSLKCSQLFIRPRQLFKNAQWHSTAFTETTMQFAFLTILPRFSVCCSIPSLRLPLFPLPDPVSPKAPGRGVGGR